MTLSCPNPHCFYANAHVGEPCLTQAESELRKKVTYLEGVEIPDLQRDIAKWQAEAKRSFAANLDLITQRDTLEAETVSLRARLADAKVMWAVDRSKLIDERAKVQGFLTESEAAVARVVRERDELQAIVDDYRSGAVINSKTYEKVSGDNIRVIDDLKAKLAVAERSAKQWEAEAALQATNLKDKQNEQQITLDINRNLWERNSQLQLEIEQYVRPHTMQEKVRAAKALLEGI